MSKNLISDSKTHEDANIDLQKMLDAFDSRVNSLTQDIIFHPLWLKEPTDEAMALSNVKSILGELLNLLYIPETQALLKNVGGKQNDFHLKLMTSYNIVATKVFNKIAVYYPAGYLTSFFMSTSFFAYFPSVPAMLKFITQRPTLTAATARLEDMTFNLINENTPDKLKEFCMVLNVNLENITNPTILHDLLQKLTALDKKPKHHSLFHKNEDQDPKYQSKHLEYTSQYMKILGEHAKLLDCSNITTKQFNTREEAIKHTIQEAIRLRIEIANMGIKVLFKNNATFAEYLQMLLQAKATATSADFVLENISAEDKEIWLEILSKELEEIATTTAAVMQTFVAPSTPINEFHQPIDELTSSLVTNQSNASELKETIDQAQPDNIAPQLTPEPQKMPDLTKPDNIAQNPIPELRKKTDANKSINIQITTPTSTSTSNNQQKTEIKTHKWYNRVGMLLTFFSAAIITILGFILKILYENNAAGTLFQTSGLSTQTQPSPTFAPSPVDPNLLASGQNR